MDHWIENYCEDENKCPLTNYVASLFTFFEKVHDISKFRF